MIIKNLGKQAETIWKVMRPLTKEILVKALAKSNQQNVTFDAHADWEISSLLNALDEQTEDSKSCKNTTEFKELSDLADTCASVLESQTESAEVFIQLAKRALERNDFAKFDYLGNVLFERFSASEIAEIIRQSELAQIRAISYETLVVLPVTLIEPLLKDPIYFEIACNVLEQKAIEFESVEAHEVLKNLESRLSFE